jgi:GNAT superfamily N-acetyltransferase
MHAAATTIIEVTDADLDSPSHQRAVVDLIDAYAQDPLANGAPLADEIKRALIPGLKQHPTTVILLALDGPLPVGIAVCFLGFSTFAARPLLNIHDIFTAPSHRGRGAGRRLLEAVAAKARQLGCCKVTLEVQENNHHARKVYAAAGFKQYALQDAGGGALYLAMPL